MVVPAISMSSRVFRLLDRNLHRWFVAQEFLDHPGGQIGFVAAA